MFQHTEAEAEALASRPLNAVIVLEQRSADFLIIS